MHKTRTSLLGWWHERVKCKRSQTLELESLVLDALTSGRVRCRNVQYIQRYLLAWWGAAGRIQGSDFYAPSSP